MTKMKLYSFYTDETIVLKDVFLKSIRDNWELNLVYWGKIGDGEGNTWSTGWYNILRRKIEFLVEKIKENYGQIIIWSDIDIQFFGICSNHINKAIRDKDIVFLSEHWPEKEINGGFIVLRCNAQTLQFFELVLQSDMEYLHLGDQTAINILLRENRIDMGWDILPGQFWAFSHGCNPPIDIVLHHANCTTPVTRDGKQVGSIQLKLEQIEMIRKYILLRKIKKYVKIVLPMRFIRFVRAYLSL